jgi:hypothetical protein
MLSSQKFSFCNWQSFTIKFFLTISTTFLTQQALAQFTDNFNDGDLLSDPVWSGNGNHFEVTTGELHLNAPAATGSAYLAAPSKVSNRAIWDFHVRMTFNPSSGNLARIYLISDNPDFSGELNGYYVQIGDTPDEISLYRQTGTARQKIIDGENNRVNLPVVVANIRVSRDELGRWELFSDVGLTGTYVLEGHVDDNTHRTSLAFGVSCVYTSTRSTAFYFDNFSVEGDEFVDTLAPELLEVNAPSSNRLVLKFSEPLNSESASNPSHYKVLEGPITPASVQQGQDSKELLLIFLQDFPNGAPQTISVSGVTDVAGNEIAPTEKSFVFFNPVTSHWKDIVISEIFADPTPRVELPEVEFIELYNRSLNPVDLKDWKISDGSASGVLLSQMLFPGEYLIVNPKDFPGYNVFGKAMDIADFPSLNNSGDILTLKNPDGILIDSVSYNDTWYRDDDKKAGGWTLELIDTENSCADLENWIVSEDVRGGTPGKQNSVFAIIPDMTGPKLVSAIPLSETQILLSFNEKLNSEIPDVSAFEMSPRVPLKSVSFLDNALRQVVVTLQDKLQVDVHYKIRITNVYDCPGNRISDEFNSYQFGLPRSADSMDIVVNEILFNPRPTGKDFVELYNVSTKYINLKGWSLANFDGEVLTNKKIISSQDFLFKPGEFLIVTENFDIVRGEYPLSQGNNFIAMLMPSMNDDEGSVAVLDDRDNVIDWFQYLKDFHSGFIKDEEGVSLERISAKTETNKSENWKSASSVVGFATPGDVNSNSRTTLTTADVEVVPEVFSPLGGQANFVQIGFKFSTGGFVANVKVIDSDGRMIKEIANNELLGTEGFFRWDGDTQQGTKARVGYYMIWFEVFNSAGEINVLKRRVAIAGRF